MSVCIRSCPIWPINVAGDLAIGAGGATTWERCCMGLPSIVIGIAENQRPACEALSQSDLIRYLGDASSITATEIQSAVIKLLRDSKQMHKLSAASMRLVDGKGVHKVAKTIFAKNGVEMSEAQMALI